MTVQVRAQFPFIAFEGTALREEVRREIVEVWVDDHLVLPDSVFVRLRFDDPDLWNRLGVSIGQKIDVRAGQLGEAAESTLITGEVTSIEAVY
ncbi:MAG: hypothetical protein KDB37_21835, partial [Ilumatobacter sp.]|nr:hypothetical protein [Ilumatobacter sp.]